MEIEPIQWQLINSLFQSKMETLVTLENKKCHKLEKEERK